MAGLGVQVLFGFLLAMPFTNVFSSLDPEQHRLYVADLLLAALATCLLTAPVACHRIVFRGTRSATCCGSRTWWRSWGLAAVALAISAAVLLVVSVVYHGLVAAILGAIVAGTYFVLWYVVPLLGHTDQDD